MNMNDGFSSCFGGDADGRQNTANKMASADVLTHPGMPKAVFKPIIQEPSAKRKAVDADFDPKKHIDFKPPPEIIMMKDLGFAEDTGVSPVAVSQPFQLFSQEAIHQMRDEIMNPKVMEAYKYQSNIAACQIRGYAPK